MKRILNILSLVLVSIVMSCNKGNTDKSLGNDSLALRLALMPTMDNLPFYYADETGIFDSLGLDIELLTYSSAMDCDTAFTNGKADGVVSDIVKANIWRSIGDSVKVVMSTDLNLYLMTSHASRIKSLQSIKEKIVAITRHSSIDYMADKVMEQAKLDLLQLNKPQINNVTLRCKMTKNNQYDGAFLPEPYALEAENNGANRLVASSELIGNLSAVMFHDSIVVRREEDIAKLVEGYDIAVNRINALVEKGSTGLLGCMHDEFIDAIPDTILVFPSFKSSSLPDRKVVSSTAEWAKGRGQMKNDVSYEELIGNRFVMNKQAGK